MQAALRLSFYWFFATGALGLYFPYITLYLKENVQLGGTEAGMIVSIPPLVGVVAQPLWGQLADRTGSRTRILSWLCVGAGFGYLGLMLPSGFVSMALAVFALAFFISPVVPMANAVSMAALSGGGSSAYGRVRVWGTVGYLCTVVAAPRVLAALRDATQAASESAAAGAPSEPALHYIFAGSACMIWLAALCARGLPLNASLKARAGARDYRKVLARRDYLRVLLFNFAAYLFLHGPMVLFPVYVRSRGGDMAALSDLWVWMLLLEVPLVAYSGRLFDRLGPRRMIALAVGAGGLRWLACAGSQELGQVYVFQMLHAVVVVGLLVGSALYVERLIPEALRSTAQAGLTMTSALGGILSSTLGGLLLDVAGVDALYWAGGAGGLVWACLAMLVLPRTDYAPAVSAAAIASSHAKP